jgi:ribbon-helix-helix CopG family protein
MKSVDQIKQIYLIRVYDNTNLCGLGYSSLVRTTINLPEPLLRSAKRQADERGVTLSALLEDALRFHLARKQPANAAPFQLDTVAGKLVQPDLDLDRTSNLEVLDDELKFAALRNK